MNLEVTQSLCTVTLYLSNNRLYMFILLSCSTHTHTQKLLIKDKVNKRGQTVITPDHKNLLSYCLQTTGAPSDLCVGGPTSG